MKDNVFITHWALKISKCFVPLYLVEYKSFLFTNMITTNAVIMYKVKLECTSIYVVVANFTPYI